MPLRFTEVDNLREKLLPVHDPGRIVWAVDNDRLRVRAHALFDILHAGVEGSVFRCDDDRNTIAHPDHLWIAHPVRGKDDHFFLGIEDRVEQVKDGLLCTRGHDDVLGG